MKTGDLSATFTLGVLQSLQESENFFIIIIFTKIGFE